MKKKNLALRDTLLILVCSALLVVFTQYYIKNYAHDQGEKATEIIKDDSGDVITLKPEDKTLDLWYTDSKLESYISYIASEFQGTYGVTIVPTCVSAVDYLESINQANLDQSGIPDVYILDSTLLEKAYLAGLAQDNTEKDLYKADLYPQTALNAVSYHGKMVAYPLCFDTSILLYNKAYAANPPATFEEILTFAKTFDSTQASGVDKILDWDVKNLLYNYGFGGSYFEFGGESGDDTSILSLSNDKEKAALAYYQNLYQYFSIDINTVSYQSVVDNFTNGKTIYAIAGTDSLLKLKDTQLNYGVAVLPNLTADLKTRSLSDTITAVVNPFASNTEIAEKLAEYMTYDKADKVFELTGKMAARKLSTYPVSGLDVAMTQYEQSVSLPKLIASSNYAVELEIAFNQIWKGQDINTTLASLESKMKSQVQ